MEIYLLGVFTVFVIISCMVYMDKRDCPTAKVTVEYFLFFILFLILSWVFVIIFAVLRLSEALKLIKPWWNEFKNKELF